MCTLLFGIFICAFIAFNVTQALEFRKFWGDKATLRQFRDGRIAEVVGEVFLHLSCLCFIQTVT